MRHVCALAVALSLLWSGIALAGSYTLTTSAREDAVLSALLTRINAERAVRGETAVTADQLLERLVRTAIGQYVAEYSNKIRTDACAAYAALSPTDQAAILTRLGGKTPCP